MSDVEIIISWAEYECAYDHEWTEVEYPSKRFNQETKQWEPFTQRLDTRNWDVYLISRDMYERWSAVRAGFNQVQEDMKQILADQRPVNQQEKTFKGLPW